MHIARKNTIPAGLLLQLLACRTNRYSSTRTPLSQAGTDISHMPVPSGHLGRTITPAHGGSQSRWSGDRALRDVTSNLFAVPARIPRFRPTLGPTSYVGNPTGRSGFHPSTSYHRQGTQCRDGDLSAHREDSPPAPRPTPPHFCESALRRVRGGWKSQESCGFAGVTWGSEFETNAQISLRRADSLRDLGLRGF